jgi:hypothetical protein
LAKSNELAFSLGRNPKSSTPGDLSSIYPAWNGRETITTGKGSSARALTYIQRRSKSIKTKACHPRLGKKDPFAGKTPEEKRSVLLFPPRSADKRRCRRDGFPVISVFS